MSKFKVGDRVQYITDGGIGSKGTVVDAGPQSARVKWDSGWKDASPRLYDNKELRLIEAAASFEVGDFVKAKDSRVIGKLQGWKIDTGDSVVSYYDGNSVTHDPHTIEKVTFELGERIAFRYNGLDAEGTITMNYDHKLVVRDDEGDELYVKKRNVIMKIDDKQFKFGDTVVIESAQLIGTIESVNYTKNEAFVAYCQSSVTGEGMLGSGTYSLDNLRLLSSKEDMESLPELIEELIKQEGKDMAQKTLFVGAVIYRDPEDSKNDKVLIEPTNFFEVSQEVVVAKLIRQIENEEWLENCETVVKPF